MVDICAALKHVNAADASSLQTAVIINPIVKAAKTTLKRSYFHKIQREIR